MAKTRHGWWINFHRERERCQRWQLHVICTLPATSTAERRAATYNAKPATHCGTRPRPPDCKALPSSQPPLQNRGWSTTVAAKQKGKAPTIVATGVGCIITGCRNLSDSGPRRSPSTCSNTLLRWIGCKINVVAISTTMTMHGDDYNNGDVVTIETCHVAKELHNMCHAARGAATLGRSIVSIQRLATRLIFTKDQPVDA